MRVLVSIPLALASRARRGASPSRSPPKACRYGRAGARPFIDSLSVLLLLGSGCGGESSSTDPEPTTGDEIVQHDDDDEPVETDDSVDPTVTAMAREGATEGNPRLVLRAMDDVDEAEDGEGHLVSAADPVAFELDLRLVPMRTEGDPLILRVGDLVLERPHTPRPGILRFILADRSRVAEGAAVTIQYGDDESTQVVVDPVLRLPWEATDRR